MPFVPPHTAAKAADSKPAAAATDGAVVNTIDSLRAELFGALRDLRAGKLDVDTARAVSELAQTVINSAKVEVEHLKAIGGNGSKFLSPSVDGTRRITQG